MLGSFLPMFHLSFLNFHHSTTQLTLESSRFSHQNFSWPTVILYSTGFFFLKIIVYFGCPWVSCWQGLSLVAAAEATVHRGE